MVRPGSTPNTSCICQCTHCEDCASRVYNHSRTQGVEVTFHPIIDKQGMVHGEGPALTHLDLYMPTAACTVHTQSLHQTLGERYFLKLPYSLHSSDELDDSEP